MSLKDLLAAEPRRPLTFEQWLATLSDDDRGDLEAAAADPTFSNAALMRVVAAAGGHADKDRMAAWRASHGLHR